MTQIFQILAIPLGYLMNWCYILVDGILHLPVGFIFAMFLFTLVTRLIQFPFAINQQKSSAKMAAINPLMQEINKKFAKDKKRQQEELQKLQTEMGVNPMSGCLPMVVQFIFLFGVIEVIYAPLTYMLKLPAEFISQAGTYITETLGISVSARLIETNIIAQAKTGALDVFADQFGGALAQVKAFDMSIGSINLWEQPSIKAPSLLWLMPVFSIVTQVISMIISNRASGASQSQAPGMGKGMLISMTAMSAVFSFMWPAAFSLYWGLGNLITMLQSLILRRIINPEVVKEKTLADYYARKKPGKDAKSVTVVDKKTGAKVKKSVSGNELVKVRLQKGRDLDAERYGEEVYADISAYPEFTGVKKVVPEKKKKEKKEKESKDTFDEKQADMFKDELEGKK